MLNKIIERFKQILAKYRYEVVEFDRLSENQLFRFLNNNREKIERFIVVLRK